MSDNEMLKLAEQIEGSSAGVPNDFAAFIQLSGSDMKLIVSALRAAAASAEPVAWIAFAGNGKVRFWTADQARAKREQLSGMDLRMFTLPELVALAGHPAPDAKIVAALEPFIRAARIIAKRPQDYKGRIATIGGLADAADLTKRHFAALLEAFGNE